MEADENIPKKKIKLNIHEADGKQNLFFFKLGCNYINFSDFRHSKES